MCLNLAEAIEMMRKEFYHGWVIQIFRQSVGYSFECQMAERRGCVSDVQCYATIEQALQAGRLRADLESVRLSLSSFLHGKLKLALLHPDEQNALEDSIDRYISTAQASL